MKKDNLFGYTLTDLQRVCENEKFPKFTAKQMADWLYKKRCSSIDDMTNLSLKIRSRLNELYVLEKREPVHSQTSVDGTKKYLFLVGENHYIESVYIPDKDRATLCISSQIGCKMGCKFCVTGKQGFKGNLTAAEILNQIFSIPESQSLTNIVYMGMGEPFDNYDNVLRFLHLVSHPDGMNIGMRQSVRLTVLVGFVYDILFSHSKCRKACL